jgi:hypothetical protein
MHENFKNHVDCWLTGRKLPAAAIPNEMLSGQSTALAQELEPDVPWNMTKQHDYGY